MPGTELPFTDTAGRKWYFLAVNPVPWAVGQAAIARKKDGTGNRVYVAPNKDLRAYQNAIREEMGRYFTVPIEGVDMDVVFVFTRSLDTIKRGKSVSHSHVADATNMQKATEDALQGILFGNDRQNRVILSIIREQEPDIEPSVAVGLRITTDEHVRNLIPPEVEAKIAEVSW